MIVTSGFLISSFQSFGSIDFPALLKGLKSSLPRATISFFIFTRILLNGGLFVTFHLALLLIERFSSNRSSRKLKTLSMSNFSPVIVPLNPSLETRIVPNKFELTQKSSKASRISSTF